MNSITENLLGLANIRLDGCKYVFVANGPAVIDGTKTTVIDDVSIIAIGTHCKTSIINDCIIESVVNMADGCDTINGIDNTSVNNIRSNDSSNSNSSSNSTINKKKCKKKEYHQKRKKERSKSEDIGGRVKWGTVEEVVFQRHVGFDVIPSSGFFPLGLSNLDVPVCRAVSTVDDYSNRKAAELILRAQAIPSMNIPSDLKLETRQMDYKKSMKNLLFQPLSEDIRINILGYGTASSPLSHESPSLLTDLNRDIKTIRASRDHNGCSCKPIKADKLSVAKMKHELISNGTPVAEVDKLSKHDLVEKVREVLKQCFLCTTNGCECVVNKVECSDQTCQCMGKGYQACNNAYGKYVFDCNKVQEYRHNILKSKEIGTS